MSSARKLRRNTKGQTAYGALDRGLDKISTVGGQLMSVSTQIESVNEQLKRLDDLLLELVAARKAAEAAISICSKLDRELAIQRYVSRQLFSFLIGNRLLPGDSLIETEEILRKEYLTENPQH